jgi:hypothetical protein
VLVPGWVGVVIVIVVVGPWWEGGLGSYGCCGRVKGGGSYCGRCGSLREIESRVRLSLSLAFLTKCLS